MRLMNPGKDNYGIVWRSANLDNRDPCFGLMKDNGLGENKGRLTFSQPPFIDFGCDLT